ncbi:MAG TPA: DUF2147 domain-containing protein [Pseudolabrys sp.]|nr:DUF2147 domain-containing protein [Pseudolabrys sp.]
MPYISSFLARHGAAIALASVSFIAGIGSATAQPANPGMPDPTGEWLTAKGYAKIRIVDCSGRLWGVVSWETYPSVDDKNPDPSKRNRPTLGMPILLGMTPSGPDKWSGEIYNSQDGHTYSASISLLNSDVLKVQGCMFGIFCGGENWSRVTQTTSAAPTPPGKRTQGSGAARAQQPASDENSLPPDANICLRVGGTTGFSHQRRLK